MLSAQDPNVDFCSASARRRRLAQSGAFVHALEASLRAALERRRGHSGAAAEARVGSRHKRVFLQNPPPIRIGGQLTKSLYQLTLQSPDTEELYKYAPFFKPRCASCPAFRTSPATCRSRIRRSTSRSTATRRQALGVTANQIETRAIRRLRAAAGFHDLRAEQPILRDIEARSRNIRTTRRRFQLLTSELRTGSWCRSTRSRARRARVGPLSVNHSGQLPAVTISFNLRPGVSLGEAVTEVARLAPRCNLPPIDHHELSGNGAGVPIVAHGLGMLLIWRCW